ncbi:MAG: DUF917 domain-containing protein [Cyanobacteriota bacterium]|nr:DUF917 domain-containing protein [Cyanobacteriota bacterium]
MRTLNKDQILNIGYGATFLGSGGGGPLKTGETLVGSLKTTKGLVSLLEIGQSLIEKSLRDRTVTVKTINEVNDADGLTAVVAFMGSPNAMLALNNIDPAIAALDLLTKQLGNRQIGHVIPVELGGLNSIVPILVAAHKGIPVIDADGAGRAVPSLTMTTFATANLPANPTVLAKSSDFGVSVLVETAADAEAFCRPALAVFGEEAGIAMWAMDKQQLEVAATIRETLQLAEEIGAILNPNSEPPAPRGQDGVNFIIEKLKNYTFKDPKLTDYKLTADRIFSGIVQDSESKTQGGFDYGNVTLKNQNDEEVWVYNQNENLIVWNPQTSASMIAAPDSICYLYEDETGRLLPFSNADIEPLGIVSKKAHLIGITARPALQTSKILNSFKKSLSDLGFRVPYQPFPKRD